uniref:Protein-S-isoprenylcysteine O-methyltransferase n=1 Tax=Solanum lycopersicum TaxID=4081 RepID=A0A3Q7EZF6_SOLLC
MCFTFEAVTHKTTRISNWGLVVNILGEIIRKLVYHEENHQLVTNGIYRFVRHLGYCDFIAITDRSNTSFTVPSL